MKLIIFSFILSFSVLSVSDAVFAQLSPTIEWKQCYGGAKIEGFNPLHDHTILQTSDGGYVFIGETESNDGDVSGNHKDSIGNYLYDIWLVKISTSGNILWQKCFGGTSHETPTCLIQTRDGGFLVSGQSRSHDGDVTNNGGGWPIGSNQFGGIDAWVFKTDSLGELKWNLCIGGRSGWQILNSVIEVDDGFIGVGSTSSKEEGWNLHGTFGDDALIVKFNSKGEMWHKLIGGSSGDIANAVIAASDSTYIFVGLTNSNDGDISGFHGLTSATVDILAVKFDSNGKIIWQKCYGSSSHESNANCIIATPKGYMIAGYTYLVNGFKDTGSGDISGYHGATDGWIVEIDSNGTLIDQHCFGGSGYDNINSIVQTKEGNFAFAGVTFSTDGDLSDLHRAKSDSSDAWVGEFSSDWKLNWEKTLGGSGTDGFYSIALTSDDGFILNGKTESNNNDVAGNHGLSDIWNVKLSKPLSRVELANEDAVFINPYPNPCSNEIQMKIYSVKAINQIQFYNLLGVQEFPSYHIDGSVVRVNISELPEGIYFLTVSFINSNIVQTGKFIHSGLVPN